MRRLNEWISNIENMRNKFSIGIIVFAVLSTQISCSQITQSEFERNHSLWLEQRIENYKMTIEIEKTGHAAPNGKFIVTVRGGVAKSIKSVDFNPDAELIDSNIRFGNYNTIEGIFGYIKSAENEKRESNGSFNKWRVEYDSKLGYPKIVDLDRSGVMDDELYFEVLEFAIEESSGEKPPKIISVPATEITKIETFVRGRDGYDYGGMSYAKDGTAFRSFREIDFNKKTDDKSLKLEKFQAAASEEQFQKLAQTLAENDFSNLKDTTLQSPDRTDYILTVTYAGKTKSVKMSLTGKNTAEIVEILNAIEKLKNQLDWTEIK